jgi:hypothetical protein
MSARTSSTRLPAKAFCHSAALIAVVAVVITACGNSSRAAACARIPQSIPTNRLLTSGTILRVPVGATVYVALVEPEVYTNQPGFPWMTPSSTDHTVLAPEHLCKQSGASTLPIVVTGFRAVSPGKATIRAPLSKPWRSRATKPQPAIDHVTVK